MPTISAIALPVNGSVLLQLSWADSPSVTYARVIRVESDGTETVVRPSTSTDASGDYMELSNGLALIYDTEAPFDVPLNYRTEGLNADGTIALAPQTLDFQNFTNASVAGWVPTSVTIVPTAAAAYSGTVSALFQVTGTPTTAGVRYPVPGIVAGHSYQVAMWLMDNVTLTGQTGLSIDWYNAAGGLLSTSTSGTGGNLATGVWQYFAFVAVAPAGAVSAQYGPTLGASPATGTAVFMDDTIFQDISGITTSATSSEVILQASGNLWLRDPLNPAHNIRVGLTPPPSSPECVPGNGFFFAGSADQTFGVQSTNWSVANRSTPITLQQVRTKASSGLALMIRTFADADMFVELMAPGTALRLDTPAKYGYSPRYIAVGDAPLSRVNADYTRQWQTTTLPYVTVARPAGLPYGTLGTRWRDLCNGPYATFDAMTAAGVTWRGVLLGQASLAAAAVQLRTWGAVLTDFVTWGPVNTGGRTWGQVLAGN